jgi:conjugal transfer pilus assembly protein TraW
MASVLANIGPVYKISEMDILEFMEHKLQGLANSGELSKINEKFKQQVIKSVQEPPAVSGITNTISSRTYYYDPTVAAPFDLKDDAGRVFHSKGDQVNPLDTVTLTEKLLFIDGTNKAQLAWALQQDQLSKQSSMIILVKGKPLALMQQLQRQIYFDQYGQITKKLGINQVPARVIQEGTKLLIEEIIVN